MDRRTFVRNTVGSIALASGADSACARPTSSPTRGQNPAESPFELEEATITSLQHSMASGRYTARSLTDLYLKRIDDTNRRGPKLGAVIETNPDATQIADQLDTERREKGARGPLHGIPILIKDNIDTADKMLTTAGSPALAGSRPSRNAFIVERLRLAGAIILGKTNLIEFAGFKGHPQFSWSTRGGLCRNPYALDRSVLGSSSGSAAGISANLAVVGVGTETHGSLMAPSTFSGVVAIKPTVGLVSRAGIVPIAHTFDTAGPIARTVTDAAMLLAAMAGGDPRDPSTSTNHGFEFTPAAGTDDLQSARIGMARGFGGDDARVDKIIEQAIEVLKQKGATIVTISDDEMSAQRLRPVFPSWFVVMTTEFKAGLNEYLQDRGPHAIAKSMKDVIDFNERNKEPLRLVNQELLMASEAAGPITSDAYRKAAAAVSAAARDDGLDNVIRTHQLDCIIGPTLPTPASVSDPVNGDSVPGSPQLFSYAALAGYPSVTLPIGAIFGLPLGLCFVGPAWSEQRLLRLAYAVEQATKARTVPRFLATADLGAEEPRRPIPV